MHLLYVKVLLSFFISFLITFYLVPVMCAIAYKLNIIDNPDGVIKTHKKPTPYLGGVAIYAGFITALVLIFPFYNNMFFFLVGTTYLLFLGLIDDLIPLKSYQKFFGQIIAVLCFLKGGLLLKTDFFITNTWRIPLSFVWILTVINAYNLVDVMDGLAASLSICAVTTFLLLALLSNNIYAALLLASLLGSLGSFFWYNKPKAQIFMGDAGSLFIGGFLAVVPFFFKWSIHGPIGFLVPVIILAIPLLELMSLIVIRTYKKIPFYSPSPDHFAIILQNKGWQPREILYFSTLLSLFLAIGSYLIIFNYLSFWQIGVSTIFFLSTCWFIVIRNN